MRLVVLLSSTRAEDKANTATVMDLSNQSMP